MTTRRTLTYTYPAPPSRVVALLQDADFLQRRSEEAGETDAQVTVRTQDNGFYASVARDRQLEVPSFARRFVQAKSRITDIYEWQSHDASWRAQYSVVIAGVPAEVRGQSALSSSVDGTRHETSFEVLVRVPLLGARLETLVADRVEQTFFDQAARNARALKS